MIPANKYKYVLTFNVSKLKMYNKFSFYSIVVQTVAPEGSSATLNSKPVVLTVH